MRLTLCLPGLLLPRQALLDTVADLELPALSYLLGRGQLRHRAATPHHDAVMRLWKLVTLPAAALRLLAEGGTAGDASWLCLDPVHLSVNRRGVNLDDPATLTLTASDDAALRLALAPLLADFGELSAHIPGHWHLRLTSACDLVTLPLPQAAGGPVDPALPGGADGKAWRRLLAEAQSVLHEHPVNRHREAAGQAVVNSLWPWGPGKLPQRLAAPFDRLWSSDPTLRGLAHASGIDGTQAPPAFVAIPGNILAVLDDLADSARRLDALTWRDVLARLERDWFAPIAGALRNGRCRSVHIAAFGPDATVELDIARHDLLKFWRRPRPLTHLAL